MRECGKIMKLGIRMLLELFISGKLVEQVEIGKKNFFNLLNPVKIIVRRLWKLWKL
jgi:hypothetical protein